MDRKLQSPARPVETVAGLPLFEWADRREAEAKRLEAQRQGRGEQSLKARKARWARWPRRHSLAALMLRRI
jgi:hypothetical protein